VDADKTGFLRSTTSLIQTMGRAARNVNARAILYADTVTPQMQAAIDETERRREKQIAYNQKHGITATTIRKAIRRGIELELKARRTARAAVGAITEGYQEEEYDREELIELLEKEMLEAADGLEFEKAARLRDRIAEIKDSPTWGSTKKISRSEVEAPKPKPGEARSRSGITQRKKKKRKGVR
jgi:excinuclease ABC subunit B